MRKIVSTFMLLGMAYGLHAGPVTPEQALRIAEKVFASDPYNTKAAPGKLDIVWDGEFEATKADLDPAFYVVGREGGGFVIVSGNDNVRPVLALSYDNPFVVEGMPENVRFWMERIKAYCRNASLATPDVVAQWNEFEDTKSTVITTSLTNEYYGSRTVEWSQDDPANLKCPVVTGESNRAVCGCVALAMSEIMTWYGYPERGKGTVPQYTYKLNGKTITVPSHELGTTYDWAALQSLKTPQQFYAEANTELGQNLGQLAYDVGTILQLSYSYDYQTSGSLILYPRLAEMMGYSKSAVERYRDYGYSDYQWNQMLKEQVSQRPVYYSGHDYAKNAGHAYVLDGYATYRSSDLVFHFNFGWAGVCNGYYYSDYQNVRDSYYGVSSDYQGMTALFDFVPDPSGSSTPVLALGYDSGGGMTMETNKNDGSVSFIANNVMNMGSDVFVGEFSLVWEDRNGNQEIVRSASASADDPIGLHGGFSYRVTFSSFDIYYEIGEKLAYYYKPDGGVYKKVSFVDPSIGLDEIPLIPAACILTKNSYSKGEYFYFRLTNHDYAYSDATWTITDPDGKTTSYSQSKDKVALSKSGKYKITATTSKETLVAFIKVN